MNRDQIRNQIIALLDALEETSVLAVQSAIRSLGEKDKYRMGVLIELLQMTWEEER